MKVNKIDLSQKKFVLFFALFCFAYIAVNLSSETRSQGREIIQRSFDVTQLDGFEAVLTLSIINNRGQERVRKVAMVSKIYDNGDVEKSLMRFLSPADVKGTGFLTYDYEDKADDMWLFMPALRKVRRIVSNEKSKGFMGSEFSYADMAPPSLSDFKYNVTGEEDVDGVLCWEIEMIPLNDDIADENGFSKRKTYIAKSDYVSRKSAYYDLDGKLEKELIVLETREVDTKNHRFKPIHMVMENKQNGRKSVIRFEKIIFKPDVKDEYFTTRYLERH